MDKTSNSQKLGRHFCKPEEWKRNRDAKPGKIPARTGCHKERAGHELENVFPIDSHATEPARFAGVVDS